MWEDVGQRALRDDVSVSEWIRRCVEFTIESGPQQDRWDEIERRLARLEQVAGL